LGVHLLRTPFLREGDYPLEASLNSRANSANESVFLANNRGLGWIDLSGAMKEVMQSANQMV